MSMLHVKKSKKNNLITEQGKSQYFPLGKAFEKQIEKQVGALKSLVLHNKKDKLKKVEGMFQLNLINDLICVQLKEIINLEHIKKYDLNYNSKREKTYNFGKYSSLLFSEKIYIKEVCH